MPNGLSPWRSGATALIAAVVASAGITLALKPSLLPLELPAIWHRTTRSDQAQVTVVIVGSAKKVAQVRAAVTKSEVVAESEKAFALRRRQVVAASYDDVGPLITSVGWQEASIAIWDPAREPPLQTRGGTLPSAKSGLADLANKPILNELEARRMLDLLSR